MRVGEIGVMPSCKGWTETHTHTVPNRQTHAHTERCSCSVSWPMAVCSR